MVIILVIVMVIIIRIVTMDEFYRAPCLESGEPAVRAGALGLRVPTSEAIRLHSLGFRVLGLGVLGLGFWV